MTWVAYYSDLSEVAVFSNNIDVELNARRYAMENHMDLIDLPDGAGLRETINAPSRAARESASDIAHRLLGPDIPADDPEPSLVDSDVAALVRETLDLGGCVKFWQAVSGEVVRIERYIPGDPKIGGEGDDLSQALINYRVKEAQQKHG